MRRMNLKTRIGLAVATVATLAVGIGAGAVLRAGTPDLPRVTSVGDALAEAEKSAMSLSADNGFMIREVLVEGRENTAASDILAALDVRQGDPIMELNLTRAKSRLESLPWVRSAEIQRRLPDTVIVRLTERRPVALWQQGDVYTLIDIDGVEIFADIAGFERLPVVVGETAPKAVDELFRITAAAPELAPLVRAAARVGERRWNLYLHVTARNGVEGEVVVRLPETEPRRRLLASVADERQARPARPRRSDDRPAIPRPDHHPAGRRTAEARRRQGRGRAESAGDVQGTREGRIMSYGRRGRSAAVPTAPHKGPVAALDIGTTKVACFIADVEDDGHLQVSGFGTHQARGMRNGQVTDMEALEGSIRSAVDMAEQMAGERIDWVAVNVSGGQPRSATVEFEVPVESHQITDRDMARVEDLAKHYRAKDDRALIHNIHVSYAIDGTVGIRDPRGMFGGKLGVRIHQIATRAGQLHNLESAVRRCHLDIGSWMVTPYASAIGCLSDDAKELGVTCIDMGGGTTSVAVFKDGNFVHMGVIPVGGLHVTNDIAQGLSTPMANAERLKTLYGSATSTAGDKRETLTIQHVGENGESDETNASQVPRSVLNQIIQARIEETFEMVRGHLEAAGFAKGVGRLVVLTGGASQLQGVREVAALVLDKQVHLAKPLGVGGLTDTTGGPGFAACAGLLRFAALRRPAILRAQMPQDVKSTGTWGRIGRWLQQNF